MNEFENKEKILSIINKLPIESNIKDIIIENIDNMDIKELAKIIKKYSDKITGIRKNQDDFKKQFDIRVIKYENHLHEYKEEKGVLDELEFLIDNI